MAGPPPQTNQANIKMLERMQDAILSLVPKDDRQSWLRSQALTVSIDWFQVRWLLEEQAARSIPTPFLVLLVFWLTIVFASVGLFAPLNPTAVVALLLCSMAVPGGIAMIMELDSPFTGP